MKQTRLKPISDKRMQILKQELPIRRALCERAGGRFVITAWNESEPYMGICVGGFCEECHNPPDWRMLHPHHSGIGANRKPLSLSDKMFCGRCHSVKKHHLKEARNETAKRDDSMP